MKSDENKMISLEKVPEVDMEILGCEDIVMEEEIRKNKLYRVADSLMIICNRKEEYIYEINIFANMF